MYFMLLAYVTLLMGVASCSHGEFANYEPEKQQKYSKAELIEQALSRMPQTRANNVRIEMVTIKDSINISYRVSEEMEIVWEDGKITKMNGFGLQPWKFSDGKPSHCIRILGPEEALKELRVGDNGLISFDIHSNPNLTNLSCYNNHLDEIDLTNCSNLQTLYVANNELSSIDVTGLSKLESFEASNNYLTNVYFNQHPYMYELFVENNQLTDLDLSGSPDLYMLTAQNNPLETLNLKECIYLWYLDISSTPITVLDLSRNTKLWELNLNNTSIKVLNNQIVCDTSFFIFKELDQLKVANTRYSISLDLSHNPNLYLLDISGSAITRVNLANNPFMSDLYATRSKLTDLIFGENDLKYLIEVRIENTPLEKDFDRAEAFADALPDRRGEVASGHLYTYSRYITNIAEWVTYKNWLINR